MTKLSIFFIAVALIGGMVGCGPFPSPPTPPLSQNLEIRDWYDLDAIRDNLGGNHTLMNDLDSNTAGYEELASPTANGGKGWEPIGILFVGLRGTFDGQGYEIRDLFINRPDKDCVGLFGDVDKGGVIKNIGVVNVTVTGEGSVGSLVGDNMGTMSNSYSTGNVTGNEGVGGLVGENLFDTVSNSYSTGSVTGYSSVGGLVGENKYEGIVSNSFWDIETSGQATSAGGTGKTTTQMKNIATFSGAAWEIIMVTPGLTNPTCIWNIVNGVTYPFLSWES